MKNHKKAIAVVSILVIVFCWHLILTMLESNAALDWFGSDSEYTVSIDPLTDIVTIKDMRDPGENPIGDALAQAALPGVFEQKFNAELFARYPPDPYAILIPHRVRLTVVPPDEEARQRAQAKKEKAEADRREAVQAYIKNSLSIERLKLGCTIVGLERHEYFTIEGEIRNNGQKNLKEIKLRFHYREPAQYTSPQPTREVGKPMDSTDMTPVYPTASKEHDEIDEDPTSLRPGEKKRFAFILDGTYLNALGIGKWYTPTSPGYWPIEAEIIDFTEAE